MKKRRPLRARGLRKLQEAEAMRAGTQARSPLGDAVFGAISGLAIGVVLLLFGLSQALFAGALNLSPGDGRFAVSYVGSFVFGGALLGLLWPLARTGRRGRHVVSAIVVALVIPLIMWHFAGAPWTWDEAAWVTWIVMTVVYGVMLARQLH